MHELSTLSRALMIVIIAIGFLGMLSFSGCRTVANTEPRADSLEEPDGNHGVPLRILSVAIAKADQDIGAQLTVKEKEHYELTITMDIEDDDELKYGQIVLLNYQVQDNGNIAQVFRNPPLSVLVTERDATIPLKVRDRIGNEVRGRSITIDALSGRNRKQTEQEITVEDENSANEPDNDR